MRLLDDEANRPLNRVWVFITAEEARVLQLQLSALSSDEHHSQDWHSHVESADGRNKELTLALYDPDAGTGDPRWRAWFKEDRWEPGMFENDPRDG